MQLYKNSVLIADNLTADNVVDILCAQTSGVYVMTWRATKTQYTIANHHIVGMAILD